MFIMITANDIRLFLMLTFEDDGPRLVVVAENGRLIAEKTCTQSLQSRGPRLSYRETREHALKSAPPKLGALLGLWASIARKGPFVQYDLHLSCSRPSSIRLRTNSRLSQFKQKGLGYCMKQSRSILSRAVVQAWVQC